MSRLRSEINPVPGVKARSQEPEPGRTMASNEVLCLKVETSSIAGPYYMNGAESRVGERFPNAKLRISRPLRYGMDLQDCSADPIEL